MLRPAALILIASLLSIPCATPIFGGQFIDTVETYPRDEISVPFSNTKYYADRGRPSAQYTIGIFYEIGQGVPKDYIEAAKWYRMAAEQGDRYAQFSLGVFYHKGQGVSQDYSEAAKWYRKAAEQGDTFAQTNLGDLYVKGEGVPRDFVIAYMWFDLVTSAKNTLDELRVKAAINKDFVASKMTPAQIAEAQRMAREWKPKK